MTIATKLMILLVEDDIDLAPKLARIFSQKLKARVVTRGSCDGAREELIDYGISYDVIIMDVRLPEREEDFETNCKRAEDWYDLQVELVSGELEAKDRKRICDSLDQLALEMDSCLDYEGGVKVIAEWLNYLKGQKKVEINWKEMPALIYLSSRSDHNFRERALAEYRDAKWLVKPFHPDDLLKRINEALKNEKS